MQKKCLICANDKSTLNGIRTETFSVARKMAESLFDLPLFGNSFGRLSLGARDVDLGITIYAAVPKLYRNNISYWHHVLALIGTINNKERGFDERACRITCLTFLHHQGKKG